MSKSKMTTNFNDVVKIEREIRNNSVILNKDLALDYLGGSIDAYHIMVENYIKEYQKIGERINKYYSEFDLDNIKALLHKIKGNCIYIGAELLYKYTSYLNELYKSNNYVNIEYELYLFIEYNNIIIKELERELK